MAQQKQLIPGNTPLYNAEECDTNFIKCNGISTTNNCKINGSVTINGNIVFDQSGNITSNANRSESIKIIAGGNELNTADSGAAIEICPLENLNRGQFKLLARTNDNFAALIGTPTGGLTWNNKNVVVSLNGVPANENGDIVTNAFATVEWVNEIFNNLLDVLEENV